MYFTGWKGLLNVGSSSHRGMDVHCMDTRVSMNNGGEWVADLNILEVPIDPNVQAISVYDGSYDHNPSLLEDGLEIVSTDCSEEVPNLPEKAMTFRSGGSWMARLAAVGITSLRKHHAVIFQFMERTAGSAQ